MQIQFPSWDEFTQQVSKFQQRVDDTINERIGNFKKEYPLLHKSIKTAIRFLPSPFDAIAETIYESSDGSDKERIDKIKEYFDKIQRQGEAHYHKIISQLDDIGREIISIKTITAREDTVQLIKDILISRETTNKQQLENLKDRLDKVKEFQKEVENVLYESYGLNWLPPDYFEAHESTEDDFENWKKGFSFNFESIKAKREFRRNIVDEIEYILDRRKNSLLLLGESGTSKTTTFMEIICDYFDRGYLILYSLGNEPIKNGDQLAKFIEKRLKDGYKLLIAVDNAHNEKSAAIFYVIDRLSNFFLKRNLRFIITARQPDYNLFVTKGLSKAGESARYVEKFRNDSNNIYKLPAFTKEEVKGFIQYYREKTSDEKALEKMAEFVYMDTGGHAVLVKFAVIKDGLLADVKEGYRKYLVDENNNPDPAKIQTALFCAMLDIENFKITDTLLKAINLFEYAIRLKDRILHRSSKDGSWHTLHPYWDTMFLMYMYNVKLNSETPEEVADERKEYLKEAIDAIFSIKDHETEKRVEAIVALMYDFAALSLFPLTLAEDVIKIPEDLKQDVKVTLYVNIIGKAYGRLGKLAEAIAFYNSAIGLDPKNTDAYYNLAISYFHLEKYEEAINSFDKVVDFDRNDAEAWFWRYMSLERLGRKDEASNSLNMVRQIDPHFEYVQYSQSLDALFKRFDPYSAEAYFNQADILYSLGRYEEALKYYNMTLSYDSNFTEAWYNKANMLYHKFGDYDEALRCYDKAIECYYKDIGKNPDQPIRSNPLAADAWLGKGNVLFKKGNFEEAIQYYKNATEIKQDYAVAWYNIGLSLSNLRRFDEAIKFYDKAIEIDPDYVDALTRKSFAIIVLGKNDEAIALLNKSLEKNAKSAMSWAYKGIALLNLAKDNEALECYDKAIEIDPDYVDAWLGKGNALSLLRRYDEAIECYEIAIEINPDHDIAWYCKGLASEGLGGYEEAIQCYDKATEIKPDYVEAWNKKGLAFSHLGNFSKAIECYDEVLRLKPDFSEAWKNKGLALSNLGKEEEAVKCFDMAISIEPSDENAIFYKGNTLYNLGNYEEAIQCYEKVIEKIPNVAEIWERKGLALNKLGKDNEAIGCYDKAIQIDPNSAELWFFKSMSLFSLAKHEESLACLDKALEIDPKAPNTWYSKGIVLSSLERYDEAIKCYDKAIEIKPDFVEAWHEKGLTFNNLGKYDEAIKCYDRMIEIDPNHANVYSNKGDALNSLGRYEDAIKQYDKAIETDPNYAEAWNGKGLALHYLKRYAEAIKYYDKATAIKPDYVDALDNKNKALYELKL